LKNTAVEVQKNTVTARKTKRTLLGQIFFTGYEINEKSDVLLD